MPTRVPMNRILLFSKTHSICGCVTQRCRTCGHRGSWNQDLICFFKQAYLGCYIETGLWCQIGNSSKELPKRNSGIAKDVFQPSKRKTLEEKTEIVVAVGEHQPNPLRAESKLCPQAVEMALWLKVAKLDNLGSAPGERENQLQEVAL